MLYNRLQNLNVIIWRNPCSSRAPPMSPPLLVTLVVFDSRRELRGPTFLPPRVAIQIQLFEFIEEKLWSKLWALVKICHSKRMTLTWEFRRKYSLLHYADFCFSLWENFKWLLFHFKAYNSLFPENLDPMLYSVTWPDREAVSLVRKGVGQ